MRHLCTPTTHVLTSGATAAELLSTKQCASHLERSSHLEYEPALALTPVSHHPHRTSQEQASQRCQNLLRGGRPGTEQRCGGLNEMASQPGALEHMVSSWWRCLGRPRKGALAAGRACTLGELKDSPNFRFALSALCLRVKM